MVERLTVHKIYNCVIEFVLPTFSGHEECNDTLVIGLANLSGVLLLLLIGVIYQVYKAWNTARNAIKRDVNLLYGIDYEAETEVPWPNSIDHQYDYMG